MASPTRWTWVWVNSGSWWWTGRPGVLRFMGLQRVRHNRTELSWTTELKWLSTHAPIHLSSVFFYVNKIIRSFIAFWSLQTFPVSSCSAILAHLTDRSLGLLLSVILGFPFTSLLGCMSLSRKYLSISAASHLPWIVFLIPGLCPSPCPSPLFCLTLLLPVSLPREGHPTPQLQF